ncbi:NAD-dependent epimerase/dehydratase family protein [Pediococcus ethanolidurans]|uniref:NAD-dependent epimerase/dehydratase family protein n=1 Tax=Pediococcus ethanolidurans TaxID=319653 RepID=UPI0021E7D72E|nr:NAD-dependent epimerase/dehydratase family protein [Pediococcus ethanolidurans]MCV3321095.1 NAD-dependent epimerase/dehydratase family protein [Pediococcus ethanolidurans]
MNKKVLVTGGNGFLSLHIILQLLNQGFQVRATLRDLQRAAEVKQTLQKNHVNNLENLSFVKADLTQDAGWKRAMTDITYVLSVASPLFSTTKATQNNATDGILRILKFAQLADVKRVVMTANFGAIGFSNKHKHSITTESNWTNPEENGLSPYEKSKLLAEKAAWKFIKQSNHQLEFATVNPVAIFGPALNNHVSGSFSLLTGLLDGSQKRIPNLPLNVVDVRDVANLHIAAMLTPEANGQRFIASADDQISLPEIAHLIQIKRPQLAEQTVTKILPNWFIRLAAPFNEQAKEGKLLLAVNRHVSNQKAKQVLNWSPSFNNEETVLAAVDTLIKNNLI